MIKYKLSLINEETRTYPRSGRKPAIMTTESEITKIGLFPDEDSLIKWLRENKGTIERENRMAKNERGI